MAVGTLHISQRHRPRGFCPRKLVGGQAAGRQSFQASLKTGLMAVLHLAVGAELAGETITASPRREPGKLGHCASCPISSLAQTAYALSQSKLWLPGSSVTLRVES